MKSTPKEPHDGNQEHVDGNDGPAEERPLPRRSVVGLGTGVVQGQGDARRRNRDGNGHFEHQKRQHA